MADTRDIDSRAKELHPATEEISAAIQSLQNKLNATGIGVEVWLDNPIIADEWDAILDRDDEPTGARERKITQLGYGRLGDGWCLQVRTATETEQYAGGSERNDSEYTDVSNPTPLLKASRAVRFEAVPALQDLLDALDARAKALIARAAQAKKIAESLK
jgi:hypothetical protein